LADHTLHGLRHDFCSLLMEQGVPDTIIAQLAGHANPAITRRNYQHGTETAHRDAMERLGAQLRTIAGGTNYHCRPVSARGPARVADVVQPTGAPHRGSSTTYA